MVTLQNFQAKNSLNNKIDCTKEVRSLQLLSFECSLLRFGHVRELTSKKLRLSQYNVKKKIIATERQSGVSAWLFLSTKWKFSFSWDASRICYRNTVRYCEKQIEPLKSFVVYKGTIHVLWRRTLFSDRIWVNWI